MLVNASILGYVMQNFDRCCYWKHRSVNMFICSTVGSHTLAWIGYKIDFYPSSALRKDASELICYTIEWFLLSLTVTAFLQWGIKYHTNIFDLSRIFDTLHSKKHLAAQDCYTF